MLIQSPMELVAGTTIKAQAAWMRFIDAPQFRHYLRLTLLCIVTTLAVPRFQDIAVTFLSSLCDPLNSMGANYVKLGSRLLRGTCVTFQWLYHLLPQHILTLNSP